MIIISDTTGRNRNDVVMELVSIHVKTFGISSPEELEQIYKRYVDVNRKI